MSRVAIIDDYEDIRELLALLLSGGHEFVTFPDGESFLKEFRPGRFALILLDIMMPGMDGFEVFRRIQTLDKHVPVVAIMICGSERERALQAGFCDYFVKPIMEMERFRTALFSHIGECATPHAIDRKRSLRVD
jgi:CheY-like chemotaxis protein